MPATFQGRNDLVIHDKKISGNAMAFYQNRVLEHGTLLFSSIQNDIAQALHVDASKFQDKAVKSVRSRVTNISDHLPTPMTIAQFMDYLTHFMMQQFQLSAIDTLTSIEQKQIQQLCDTKFSTWAWNYGQSPQYSFKRKIRTQGGTVEVMLHTVAGKIQDIHFFGDFFSRKNPEQLAEQMKGLPHDISVIHDFLNKIAVEEYFNHVTSEELFRLFL